MTLRRKGHEGKTGKRCEAAVFKSSCLVSEIPMRCWSPILPCTSDRRYPRPEAGTGVSSNLPVELFGLIPQSVPFGRTDMFVEHTAGGRTRPTQVGGPQSRCVGVGRLAAANGVPLEAKGRSIDSG